MKKIISIVLMATLFVGVALTTPFFDDKVYSWPFGDIYTDGFYSYTVLDGEATIIHCTDTSLEITIPSTIAGYPVTEVAYFAFNDCSNLTTITVPKEIEYFTSVTGLISFDSYLFDGCKNLTNIIVDSENQSYSSLDGVLFDKLKTEIIRCPLGKTLTYTVPDSVTKIGFCAFYECSGLTNITLPGTVTTIDDEAFTGCSGLKGITLPGTVTTINDYAFNRCSGLTSITLPSSVTSFGHLVFSGCSSLQSINVESENNNYSSVDGVLFNKSKTELIVCPVTKSGAYTVPDGVTSIFTEAFKNCIELTSVTFPNSVTSIESSAFWGCNGLTTITLPNNITFLPLFVFALCNNLTSVVLPSSLTSFQHGTFDTDIKPTLYFKDSEYFKNFCETYNYDYVVVDESSEFQLSITNATYDAVNKKIDVSVGVYNANSKNINTALLLAIYDKTGKFVKVQRYNFDLSSQAITVDKTVTFTQDLPSGCSVKAFLWGGVWNMTPIAVPSVKTIS